MSLFSSPAAEQPNRPVQEAPGAGAKQRPEKMMEEMVAVFTDPIIVKDPGWPLPERLMPEITTQRLIRLMLYNKGKADLDEATDAEALLYISNVSMEIPLGHEWVKIMEYLMGRVFGPETLPEDMRVAKLDSYEMSELRSLKLWIRKKQLQARRTRPREKPAPNAKPEKYPPPPVTAAKFEMGTLF